MPVFIDPSSATRKDKISFKKGEGVDTTSLAYDRQKARWDLTNDLRGGSDAMRDSGVKWLSMEKGEKLPEYRARLGRTHLLGAYDDAVEKMVAKPFSRDVQILEADKLSEKLALTAEDPDLEDSTVTSFFRHAFDTAVDRGLVHVLVEYAAVEGELNAMQEREMRLHPYFVEIPPDQLIGAKFRRMPGGRKALSQVRIKMTVTEDTLEYGEVEVETIRIINAPVPSQFNDVGELVAEGTPGTWEVWRMDPKSEEWTRIEGPYAHTYPGIPLRTVYLDKKSDLEGRPTLWRLAELNLEHYQKKSDQDNLLHVARVPILARFGFSVEELKKPVVVGAGRSVGTTNKDARMEFVEHSGQALGAGQADLDKLEEQMERAGLEPLTRRAASSLATNMMIGDAKETNLLQAWAGQFEVFIEQCFEVAGIWVGEDLPEGFAVDIFNEYGLSARATDNLKILDAARGRGDISHETYLDELKRYAALSSGVDTQEEMARVEREGPALGMIGVTPEGQSPSNESDDDKGTGTTGTTNGHAHEIADGASATEPGGDDNHTHPIAEGATRTGPASDGDPHTHLIPEGYRI